MFRGYVGQHEQQQVERFEILGKVSLPADVVHVLQRDLRLTASNEKAVLIVDIQSGGEIEIVDGGRFRIVAVDFPDSGVDEALDTGEGQSERIDRTFKPFQQIAAHQLTQTALPSGHGEVRIALLRVTFCVFGTRTGQDE